MTARRNCKRQGYLLTSVEILKNMGALLKKASKGPIKDVIHNNGVIKATLLIGLKTGKSNRARDTEFSSTDNGQEKLR